MKKSFFIPLFFGLIVLSCNQHATDKTASNVNKKHVDAFTNFGTINFLEAYQIEDETSGTKTTVTIQGDQRIMITNALPNHTTGKFPNSGNPNTIAAQKLSYKFPLNPKYTGKAVWAREPGIAVNGIKFEPQTAERFICETGEEYSVEAFQDLIDLGLDKNNAHVQPTGAYHYHGAPTGLISKYQTKEDLVLIGFAHDGFPMYYSLSNKYKPSFKLSEENRTGDVCSYKNPSQGMTKKFSQTTPDGTFVSDWEYQADLGDLDECNGITIDGKYCYLVTLDYPYVGRCLMGEFTPQRMGPPPGGNGGHGHPHPNGEHHPPRRN